jgi:hypothetical protein
MKAEIKELILKHCGTLDGQPFIEVLDSLLSDERVSFENCIVKIALSSILDINLLKSKLEALSKSTTGRRVFSVSVESDFVLINPNTFREMGFDQKKVLSEIFDGLSKEGVSVGLSKALEEESIKFDERYSDKSEIKILSVGCGNPTREINGIIFFLCLKYPTKKFYYFGVDIDDKELSQYSLVNDLNNIQVKLVKMSGTDIGGLKQITGGQVDLIIMNHPGVIQDFKFVSTFINFGIPKLLVDNGSLVIINYSPIEQEKLLQKSLFNFSSFSYVKNYGVLGVISEADKIYEIGLVFGDYRSPRHVAANDRNSISESSSSVSAAAAAASPIVYSVTRPNQRSIFSAYKSDSDDDSYAKDAEQQCRL